MKSLGSLVAGIGMIALSLLTWAACAQQSAMTSAMREQQAEMSGETRRWVARVAAWRREHDEMHTWLAGAAGAGTGDGLRSRLADHERTLAAFQPGLDAHQARLDRAAHEPEHRRVRDHAALWAEHVRLKATFEALEIVHDRLAQDWTERLAEAEPRAVR